MLGGGALLAYGKIEVHSEIMSCHRPAYDMTLFLNVPLFLYVPLFLSYADFRS